MDGAFNVAIFDVFFWFLNQFIKQQYPTDDFTVYKIQVELNDVTNDTVFLL